MGCRAFFILLQFRPQSISVRPTQFGKLLVQAQDQLDERGFGRRVAAAGRIPKAVHHLFTPLRFKLGHALPTAATRVLEHLPAQVDNLAQIRAPLVIHQAHPRSGRRQPGAGTAAGTLGTGDGIPGSLDLP